MSEIVLIYPYVYQHAENAMLFHPLGIAQLSALLREEGLDTSIRDLTFCDADAVVAELALLKPRIVGIYVMLTMVETAHNLAGRIRSLLPGTLLVCGGPLPTLRPELFIPDFDCVFLGEAVKSFPRFCRDYLRLDSLAGVLEDHGRYPGLFARNHQAGTLVTTLPQQSGEEELKSLPIPDRTDYLHDRYQQFWQEREGYSPAGIMTTYGCPHDCDFCSKPVFGRNFRKRDMDRIFEEILDIRSFGYDGLWIADDCFTLDLDHVRAFCRRMVGEGLDMKWSCLSRTEPIPLEDVELMRQAGCHKVFFGLESGSNDVLKLMNKHATVEEAEHMVRLFSRCGIATAGFFMVGYPGETYETIETTLAWALTLPLNEISFTIPFPLPDTELYRRVCVMRPDADWRYENENRMVYQSEFDEAHLKKRILETSTEFAARQRAVPR